MLKAARQRPLGFSHPTRICVAPLHQAESLVLGRMLSWQGGRETRIAKRESTGEVFVVKVAERCESEEEAKDHIRAYEPCGRLQLAHVVRLLGVLGKDTTLYLAYEYMDSGSLADAIRLLGPAEEPVLSCIAGRVLAGLSELHANSVTHGNLKPENVMLSLKDRGEVKITDNVIKGAMQKEQRFVSGEPVRCYYSPERIKATKHTEADDIWALGMILLEARLGYFPVRDKKNLALAVLERIVDGVIPIPPERVSSEFHEFLSLCFCKHPDRRLSAEQLLEHPWIVSNSHNSNCLRDWIGNVHVALVDKEMN